MNFTDRADEIARLAIASLDTTNVSDILGVSKSLREESSAYRNFADLTNSNGLATANEIARLVNPYLDITNVSDILGVSNSLLAESSAYRNFADLTNANGSASANEIARLALPSLDAINVSDILGVSKSLFEESSAYGDFADLTKASQSANEIARLAISSLDTTNVSDILSVSKSLFEESSAYRNFADLTKASGSANEIARLATASFDTKSILSELGIAPSLFDTSYITIHDIEAIDGNTISVNGETVNFSEIDEDIDGISRNSHGFVEFFEQVSLLLDRLSGTVKYIATSYVFAHFVLPFLFLLAAINYQSLLCFRPECEQLESRIAVKDVIKKTTNAYPPETLYDYRVVTAQRGLHVRSIGNRKGEIIGSLTLGSRVMLVLKARDWSLVDYYDQGENEYLQGWVFSRHLKKFNE